MKSLCLPLLTALTLLLTACSSPPKHPDINTLENALQGPSNPYPFKRPAYLTSPSQQAALSKRFLKNILAGNTQKALVYIAKGHALDFKNKDGESGLMLACLTQNHPLLEALIEKGADVNIKGDSSKKLSNYIINNNLFSEGYLFLEVNDFTPLMMATAFNNVNMVRSLLGANANSNMATQDGKTALHFVKQNATAITSLLIRHGANINHQTHKGVTPLYAAINKIDAIKRIEHYPKKQPYESLATSSSNTAKLSAWGSPS